MNEYIPKSLSEKDGYFPPPWNSREYPEKTEGWIAFQKWMETEDYKIMEKSEKKLND